jgi:hypothetical protein
MQTADLIPLLDHWVAREREKHRERTAEETDQLVEMALNMPDGVQGEPK